jgi:hypothetical protein
MGLILSLVAALAGSVAGSGVRAGVRLAEQQLDKKNASSEPLMVNGSLVGGVAAGVLADAIGGGAGLAFWLGAVLGAAGADRLDFWVLRRVGVNPDDLMARARDAAMEAQERARGLAPRRESSPETEPAETT